MDQNILLDGEEITPNEVTELKEFINKKIEEELKSLRNSYEQALVDNKDSFIWEGEEMSTPFAKYFLEHHESKLKTL